VHVASLVLVNVKMLLLVGLKALGVNSSASVFVPPGVCHDPKTSQALHLFSLVPTAASMHFFAMSMSSAVFCDDGVICR
jgi:hypothetical protein